MQSRRDILKLLGVTAGALGISASAAAQGLAAFADAQAQAGAPLWLLAPLAPGSSLGKGWTLETLSAVERGASVLGLRNADGRAARVHLCARDGRPRGVAHTALFDLMLMDGGQGDHPTDEGLGRALLTLASRVRNNELQTADRRVIGLLSHVQRVERFGAATFV